MARYCGAVCRLCRREGEKLFLKGDRCFSNKCAVERREGAPGVHGKARGQNSEYKRQLREKQKVKRMYGLLERQFRNLFHKAESQKGVTGESLLRLLEARLDNMVYRAGLAASRNEGRQYVTHGHFLVNGLPVNIPSYLVKPGDVVRVVDKMKQSARMSETLASAEARRIPEWLELDKENMQFVVRALPSREQITHPMKEQLIVELYSK